MSNLSDWILKIWNGNQRSFFSYLRNRCWHEMDEKIQMIKIVKMEWMRRFCFCNTNESPKNKWQGPKSNAKIFWVIILTYLFAAFLGKCVLTAVFSLFVRRFAKKSWQAHLLSVILLTWEFSLSSRLFLRIFSGIMRRMAAVTYHLYFWIVLAESCRQSVMIVLNLVDMRMAETTLLKFQKEAYAPWREPISLRNCTERKSMASEREWRPLTAVKSSREDVTAAEQDWPIDFQPCSGANCVCNLAFQAFLSRKVLTTCRALPAL